MEDYLYIYNNGEQYDGEWNDRQQRHGSGKYNFANGDTYAGEWMLDEKHGGGTYTFADGKILAGFFEHDRYIGTRHKPVMKKKKSSVKQYCKQKAKHFMSNDKATSSTSTSNDDNDDNPANPLARDATDGLIQFNRFYGLSEEEIRRKKETESTRKQEYEERKVLHNIRVKEMRDKYMNNIKN